jgi:hypothetical protein
MNFQVCFKKLFILNNKHIYMKSPPAAPHTGGRHVYNGVLPGAPRGSFLILAIYHPSAMQPSSRCLTPWLRWFGPVENKDPCEPQDQQYSLGGRGVSQMAVGSATIVRHAVLPGKTAWLWRPWGLTPFPPLHVGWLSCFRVLSQKACGTLTVL